jgi:hypothetical protein
MNKKKKITVCVSIFIGIIIFLTIAYFVGYFRHVLIPHAEKLGRLENFVLSSKEAHYCNLVVVVRKGVFAEKNNFYGEIDIISSSGTKLHYELSLSSLKKCNWISGIDVKTEDAYILFNDNKFSELVRLGDILFIRITSEKLRDGILWVYYLKPIKDRNRSTIRFINCDLINRIEKTK